MAQRYGDPSLARDLVEIKEQCLIDGHVPVPLLGNVSKFLETIGSMGIPVGVASNSRSRYVHQVLLDHGLLTSFQTIICSDDVARPKPFPDMFLRCGNLLGVDSSNFHRILVFEDSVHGIKTARDAGMTAIGITSLEPAEVLLDQGAVATFPELGAATPLLCVSIIENN